MTRHPRLIRRAVLLIAAALSVTGAAVVIPGAAHAQTYKAKDARGDVVTFTLHDGESPAEAEKNAQPAPKHKDADVVRTVVAHRGEHLKITVKLRKLRPRKDHATLTTIKAGKHDYLVMAGWFAGTGKIAELTRNDKERACAGLSQRANARRNELSLTVPRRCLDNPSRVRVGLAMATYSFTEPESPYDESPLFTGYADDAFKKGAKRKQGFTPWLRHN